MSSRFDTARAWKDIYGSPPGHVPLRKSEFYGGGFFSGLASSFITERDPSVHAKLRKTLLTAFSDRSLKEQEYLIDEGVDEFMSEGLTQQVNKVPILRFCSAWPLLTS